MVSSGTTQLVEQKRLDCLNMLLKWSGKEASDGVKERLMLDKTDYLKKTALHIAAASGLSLCVQSLVAHGASIFCEDNHGLTACDIAEQKKHTAVAAFLETKMVFNVQEEEILEIEDANQQTLNDEEYSGLCAQDLQEIKDQLIVETSDMLQVPLFTAEALLRNHEWSREMLLESWMQDPHVACEKAGVKLAQDHVALDQLKNELNGARKKTISPCTSESRNHNCDICDEVLPANDSITEIPCGHMFCNLCWERYLSTKIKDGDTHNILCPGHNCDKLVPVEITEKLVSRDMAKRYLQFDIKAFVDTNPNLRWCPHPGCGRAVKLPEAPSSSQRQNSSTTSNAKSVDCGLGHYFCWMCLGEAHEPCNCETWQKWLKKVDEINPNKAKDQAEDRESIANAFWLISNSKKCPNCRSHIQKNEGCNHMTCSKCKYDFCWVCLEPWKLHSSETGGYFRCNRYDVTNVLEQNHERELKKIEKEHDEVQQINRFMHYYTRCKNHENSFQMEMKLLNAAEEKVSGLQKAAEQLDVHGELDTDFIEDSIRELLKARQILKSSYPYGFFLEDDEGRRAIFESMQEEVEEATETLSGMVAHAYLKTPRKKIINATRKLRRKKREFLTAIERGLIPKDCEADPKPSRFSRQEPMESRLLEWLEMVKLEINNTTSNASGDERMRSISSLRRRIADACQRRETPAKVKSRSKKYGISLQDPATSQIGAASAVASQRRPYMKLRGRKVLGADDSTSSDEEGERAVRGSDSVVMVTDDSDSKSGYCIPKRGMLSASRERKMVVVQVDYVASSPSELSLEVGDVIDLMGKRSDGWWRGRCRGKEGLFPSNFVVELDPDEDTNLRALIKNDANGQSSAVKNLSMGRAFLGTDDSTSSDEEGARAIRRSDPCILLSDDSDSKSDSCTPKAGMLSGVRQPKRMVIVEFDFIASSPSELSLEAGDIIELIGKRDDGWWRGRCQGKEGLFPSNFVVELDPDDDANLESLKENAATGHSPADAADKVLQRAIALSLAEYASQDCSSGLKAEDVHIVTPPDAFESTESITNSDHEA